MEYKLTDLIDMERTQKLLDGFSDVVGVAAAIVDLDGRVLVGSRWQKICTEFHRKEAKTCERCIESDTVLANELLQGRTFSFYRCRNGLTDAASPIVIEGRHVANAFVGQFLLGKPDRDFFRRQAAQYGFNESGYLDALSAVPVVAEEALPAILTFLTSFAEMMASMGLKQLRQLEVERELQKARAELEERVEERTSALVKANQRLHREMEERRLAQQHVTASNALLRLMTEASTRKEYLDGVVSLIRQWSGNQCVGIRVVGEKGRVPYESYVGFSKEFWERENDISLRRDQCICTRVIGGDCESQDLCCMTPGGSYVLNDSEQFLRSLSPEEQKRFRGYCMMTGYRSLSVIPIRYEGNTLGAIHLADERKGMLPEKLASFIEKLTPLLGEGISRFNIRDALKQHYDTQEAINALLQLSLQDIELEELLSRALDIVLSISWLAFEKTGIVFLLDKKSNLLVMKAQRGLEEAMKSRCTTVPVGECVCGDVARSGDSRFIGPADLPAQVPHTGRPPHGLYCVPIKLGHEILGVMNIFVNERHSAEQKEETFLRAVANTLAGIIQRRKLEASLRESEEKFHAIFDQAFQFVGLMSPEGILFEVNQTALDFAGIGRPEAIGRLFWETKWWSLSKETQDRLKEAIERSARGEFIRYEVDVAGARNRVSTIDFSLKPVKNDAGRVTLLIPEGRDITDRIRAERELQVYMKRLEQSNQALQDFASIASHDMQEPLRKILAFGYQLKRKYGEALGEQGGDFIERMQKAAERMQTLLNALLHYSRITTRAEPFTPVDLGDLIRDVLEDLEIRTLEVGAKIEVGPLPTIDADPHQMSQLFQNLIGNALKYHKEGDVEIRVHAEPLEEAKLWRLVVEDNGIGFDEKYLDRIFAPFQRLHVRSEYEGTGMGLAICKKIVQRHGGTITAQSAPGAGAKFILILPARQTG